MGGWAEVQLGCGDCGVCACICGPGSERCLLLANESSVRACRQAWSGIFRLARVAPAANEIVAIRLAWRKIRLDWL
jgi:hypothetical protein